MTHTFFRALNPLSKKSGVIYTSFEHNQSEMIDLTICENIRRLSKKDFDFFEALAATYEAIVGNHYDLTTKDEDDNTQGAKGVLDLFIFTLLSRKLITDYFSKDRHKIINVASWIIAIPLELLRGIIGLVLTILLIPIVAAVHVGKALTKVEGVEEAFIKPK